MSVLILLKLGNRCGGRGWIQVRVDVGQPAGAKLFGVEINAGGGGAFRCPGCFACCVPLVKAARKTP